jgi:hypothetical protein
MFQSGEKQKKFFMTSTTYSFVCLSADPTRLGPTRLDSTCPDSKPFSSFSRQAIIYHHPILYHDIQSFIIVLNSLGRYSQFFLYERRKAWGREY